MHTKYIEWVDLFASRWFSSFARVSPKRGRASFFEAALGERLTFTVFEWTSVLLSAPWRIEEDVPSLFKGKILEEGSSIKFSVLLRSLKRSVLAKISFWIMEEMVFICSIVFLAGWHVQAEAEKVEKRSWPGVGGPIHFLESIQRVCKSKH